VAAPADISRSTVAAASLSDIVLPTIPCQVPLLLAIYRLFSGMLIMLSMPWTHPDLGRSIVRLLAAVLAQVAQDCPATPGQAPSIYQ